MEYLLKASAITALFYVCYKLFLQRETFFKSNRWYLLTGILATLLLPLLVIPVYIDNPHTNIDLSRFSENINLTSTSTLDYTFIVFSSIYMLGVAVFSFKLVFEFISLYRLIPKNKSLKKGDYTYIETEDSISPFSFFHCIVFNRKQFNEIELEQILNHEKVHAKQWHSLDIIFVKLAAVIFWFNPFIWFYKKEIQQNLEFIADKDAQDIATCKKTYQYVLLKTSISNPQLEIANNFYTSLIKKRIVMLHQSKSNKLNALKLTLVLPLLALFLMSFNSKEIYLNKNSANISQSLGDIELVIISKDFTDAELDKVKSEFKNKEVSLQFKKIKRNDLNEIIAIKIEASSKKTKTNYSTNSSKTIKPIKITYNSEDNSISIVEVEDNTLFITEEEGTITKIIKTGSDSKVIVLSEGEKNQDTDHDIEVIIKEDTDNKDKSKVVVKRKDKEEEEEEEEVYFITKDHNGKEIIKTNEKQTWVEDEDEDETNNKTLFLTTEVTDTLLIFIDDKESTREEMNNLNPENIKKMEVFKGDKMTKKYGAKAKDGVILITTK
ncbi:hypothetical protein KO494_12090 [Lacinutrix sp. C3R15]|uniref:M56 family metallopeptidase n=1 Tax=Flavobacteriaceae TaxID=49546 RepID=UPI001C088E79|nr:MULTISPECIES: M56 family metallopeptidase [Flavobacteriaceae]MBU2940279.1 hypothetical protein [Lacinutrix sp. C3R15]MDO6623598.1 M56 family metallopeptidase [Oceanihabitans sp. 1_MG-2023]